MKVKSDVKKCEGFASCMIIAPDVFDLDDDNIVTVLDDTPPENLRGEVEEAIRSCPRSAIWLDAQ